MSLFGSPMGDDDDLIFESSMPPMRHMRYMMNSLFNDPFGMMGQNAITNDTHRSRNPQNDLQMMQFGFPPMMFNMNRLFANFDNMAPNGNCHSFTSRSVMTMASGPDGQPQVYQETMSTTTAPGGVKETKKTVCDSHTGVKKMAIGHHIGERAHILEREHNVRSGEQEERQEFINLEEEEAESFNNEWERRTRHAIGGNSRYGAHGHRSRPDHRQLALPDPSGSRYSNSSRWTPSPRRNLRLPPTSKTHTSAPALSSDTSGHVKSIAAKPTATTTAATATATVTASSTNAIGNRKREHTPEAKVCKKRHAVSDSNI